MTLNHAAGAGRHSLVERGADLYETPPVAVEALLRVERLPHSIWEPASGRGAIVQVLRDRGHTVIASDLIDYGFALNFVADFLLASEMPAGCGGILTNPPYQIADQFTRHALDLAPLVFLLLRLAFLESERRSDILEQRGLRAVHVFKKRLPMMHRDGWTGPRASSAIPFAWLVWSRDHRGPPIFDRVSWDDPAQSNISPRPERTEHRDENRKRDGAQKTEGIAKMSNIIKKPAEQIPQPEAEAKLDNIAGAEPTSPAQPPDDFPDLSTLRLDQAFAETAGVKKLLTTVPVRKPNQQDWNRAHPAREYRDLLAVIELRDDREIYLLLPHIARELPGEFYSVVMHTAINRQGVIFLWPVKLPGPDGKQLEWHRSMAEAVELAMTKWVRVKANMALGAYDIYETESTIADPQWPDISFHELVRIAFRSRLVTNFDHPVIKRLRGLA